MHFVFAESALGCLYIRVQGDTKPNWLNEQKIALLGLSDSLVALRAGVAMIEYMRLINWRGGNEREREGGGIKFIYKQKKKKKKNRPQEE